MKDELTPTDNILKNIELLEIVNANPRDFDKTIKQLAKMENVTELELITLLQAGAAILKDENALDTLCGLKTKYVDEKLFNKIF